MTTIYALHRLDGDGDGDTLLGVFSTQQNALLWVRRYRLATGDTRFAIPVKEGSTIRIGARFWIIPMELDPPNITREQWLANNHGAIASDGANTQ